MIILHKKKNGTVIYTNLQTSPKKLSLENKDDKTINEASVKKMTTPLMFSEVLLSLCTWQE